MLNSTSSGTSAIEVAMQLGTIAAIEFTLSLRVTLVGPSQFVGISLSVGPDLGKAFGVDSTRPTSLMFSHVVSSPGPYKAF